MDPLQQLLEDAGFEPRSYSGRGMYGHQCIGVVVESLPRFLSDFMSSLDDDMLHQFVENGLRDIHTDSMGKSDIIVYWPDTEWTEPE